MKLLLLLAAVAAASPYEFPQPPSVPPENAPAGQARTVRFQKEFWQCFTRAPVNDRVDRHLPRKVCVAAVSAAFVVAADGEFQWEGGMRHASAPHASRVQVAGGVDGRRIPIRGEAVYARREGKSWHAWTVVDRSPEDPAGDSAAVTFEFRLDRAGRIRVEDARVYGEVACLAPVCQGAVSLVNIDYLAEPPRGPQ